MINLTRETWQISVALLLHMKCGWEHKEATDYAGCMAASYYDDPDFMNEEGEIISPEEAILADMEYWEYANDGSV